MQLLFRVLRLPVQFDSKQCAHSVNPFLPRFAMDHDVYTALPPQFWTEYLSQVYNNVDVYHEFTLKHFHNFYQAYQPPAGGAKVLEFGGGPTISNLISAAPKCQEIVFGEFREDNREHVKLWLKKDPSAFNWEPFFNYVVCTLEGGSATDAMKRKETLRSAIKAVVHCDIFQPEPVADQGPYDIVTTCLCLEYVCQNTEEYREGLAKLARLLKPGGTLLLESDENVDAWTFAGTKIQTHPISREVLTEALRSAGFSHIAIDTLPYESLPADVLETVSNITSTVFVTATK